MAAPRSLRPFLAPVRRAKISTPRPCTQPFSRTKSSQADGEETRNHAEIMAEIEQANQRLEERLANANVSVAEYKQLRNSERKAAQRFQKWEPRTKEEAKARWAKLQDTPDHLTLLEMFKAEGIEPLKMGKERGYKLPTDKEPLDPKTQEALEALRTPVNVQAVHLRPLRREPEHGVRVCDLQLRTYSIRNLLLFADFAVRAAYYMGLCARGPIPLPRITERWTVPRANFIFKKSQENFERITMRRLIQIQDGHPDVVKAWIAFLQKHQYYGVGMKANIWEYESLESATRAGYDLEAGDYSRRREGPMLAKVDEILNSKGFKEAMKGHKGPAEVELRP